jgi:7,8-dihydropterin-6-yl-methyl-4-(beta-D-ribofuranosyl)aminobenzene 5'-phosphate synthase
MTSVYLQPVDAVEVTVVVDNYVDILAASDEITRRAPLPPILVAPEVEHLRAEHGYSLHATVVRNGSRSSILYDAGLGFDTLTHNLDVLGIPPSELRAVVLSHGHADHHGGLEGIIKRLGRTGVPFVLHPDAWLTRRVVFPTGVEIAMPPPSRRLLETEGVAIVDERGPTLLIDDTILVSGQTERTTGFEKGFPWQEKKTDQGWEPDPWIWDDQSVTVNVAGRGLVTLSSCSHSGAINVIRHVSRLTGESKVHAFVGGFHLTGGLFEQIIPMTIDELVAVSPDHVIPGHCTGWRATNEIIRRLPSAFLQTSVGTTFAFGSSQPAEANPKAPSGRR